MTGNRDEKIRRMKELAAVLRCKRMKRGSIDFDFPETKIILDQNGTPLEILPYERNVATNLIEDFMLIANETVAQSFFLAGSPVCLPFPSDAGCRAHPQAGGVYLEFRADDPRDA